jgi:hypothetical protein
MQASSAITAASVASESEIKAGMRITGVTSQVDQIIENFTIIDNSQLFFLAYNPNYKTIAAFPDLEIGFCVSRKNLLTTNEQTVPLYTSIEDRDIIQNYKIVLEGTDAPSGYTQYTADTSIITEITTDIRSPLEQQNLIYTAPIELQIDISQRTENVQNTYVNTLTKNENLREYLTDLTNVVQENVVLSSIVEQGTTTSEQIQQTITDIGGTFQQSITQDNQNVDAAALSGETADSEARSTEAQDAIQRAALSTTVTSGGY